MTKGIPEGFHTLTPHLVVRGAADALEFYKKAFGAEEIHRMPGPDGKLMHAELKIGNSMLMLADEFPEWGSKGPESIGGSPVVLSLYVEDCDTVYNQAVEAGATVRMPLADQFWGDRYGQLTDPFGHIWGVCTNIKQLTPEEINEAAKAAMGGAPCE
ncbi:MAG TPA: VOC family protein [Blastocatellia bacterium]|nr:VOC family protein [Blastocatellia bacterium]